MAPATTTKPPNDFMSTISTGGWGLTVVLGVCGFTIICTIAICFFGCRTRDSFLRKCCRRCCAKKKKTEQLPTTVLASSTNPPSSDAKKEDPSNQAPATSPAAGTPVAKPIPQPDPSRPWNAAQQAAAIEAGLTRDQKDDETIDDAKSDWGRTQKGGQSGASGASGGTSGVDGGTGELRWKRMG